MRRIPASLRAEALFALGRAQRPRDEGTGRVRGSRAKNRSSAQRARSVKAKIDPAAVLKETARTPEGWAGVSRGEARRFAILASQKESESRRQVAQRVARSGERRKGSRGARARRPRRGGNASEYVKAQTVRALKQKVEKYRAEQNKIANDTEGRQARPRTSTRWKAATRRRGGTSSSTTLQCTVSACHNVSTGRAETSAHCSTASPRTRRRTAVTCWNRSCCPTRRSRRGTTRSSCSSGDESDRFRGGEE